MHLSIGEKHIVPRRRVAALRLKISSSLREEARRRVKVVLEETEAVEWVLWSGAEVGVVSADSFIENSSFLVFCSSTRDSVHADA